MTPLAYISWQEDAPKEAITSLADLRSVLLAIDIQASRNRPIVVVVERSSGAVLTLVLGHDRSMLDIFPEDYDGLGSMHSVDLSVGDDEGRTLEFFCFTHHSEVPWNTTVPKETALQCVEEFVTTAGFPKCIQWEED